MENEEVVAGPENWVRRPVKVNKNAAARPGTWVRRLVRVVALASVALVALYVAASLIWRFSGSNQWELARDQDGVKVYTLKAPGSDLIQAKGVTQVHSTLGGLVKLMTDPSTCDGAGCHAESNNRVDEWLEYASFTIDLPFPFQNREFAIRSHIHQDPRTKEILVVVGAAPDRFPPNDCCFRVTEMNNTWRFTPLENGLVEVEFVYNLNLGGYIPVLLMNTQRPKRVADALLAMKDMLPKKKYQDAKLDYIKER
ncbi:MAG: hypothetical protein J2P31_15085 [Blastocatellia bacterium]|nr:hypothetical protein [Blastocatellia bacterium]